MAQLAQHWTQISLHIHLLLSTCLLHLPLALKMKREANTNLIPFFRKWESVVTCAGRQAQRTVVVPREAFLQLSKAASELPAAANLHCERGTARHPVSHCRPESLPHVLNRRCRQLGNSLKLHRACQPVFSRTSQPKCL